MPYTHKPGERDAVMANLIARYGAAEVARRLDPSANFLSRQSVHRWPRIPERWVERAAQEFNLSLHEIRPDLYSRNGRRVFDASLEPAPLNA